MKKVVFAVFLLPCMLHAQVKDIAVSYAETITATELRQHVEYLAGPDCEGRETGERGQKVAAAYLANYFKSLGIEPVVKDYFQVFPLVSEKKNCGSGITVGGNPLVAGTDYICYCGFNTYEAVFSGTQAIPFAGYGIETNNYSDYKKVDVKGKWVIIQDGEPVKKGVSMITKKPELSSWSRSVEQKITKAEEKGAIGVLIIVDGDITRKYDDDNYIALEGKFNAKHIPYIYISKEAADRYFPGHSVTDMNVHIGLPDAQKTGENVLAYIEGTDLKDELVVITAHYDHLGRHDGKIYYGADDDGSGTASIMEIAEAFMEAKKNGNGPRRSILIMPVSGEEKGLLGSEYYSEHPVFPLEKTVADLNIDMIGRIDDRHKDANYVYLIGADKLSSELHTLSEKANKNYTQLDLDYTYNDPKDPNMFYYRSDHYNFAKHSIPVIFYFTGVHKDYHKPTDTADKLDYDKTARIARLVFYTAWEIANRNEKLKVDKENIFENWR